MEKETVIRRRKMAMLEQILTEIEADRAVGVQDVGLEELDRFLSQMITKVEERQDLHDGNTSSRTAP